MIVRRLAAITLGLGVLAVAAPAGAALERQVILILRSGIPYEAALGDPVISELVASGGIGLMTTPGETQTPEQAAVSLSAGRSAEDAPSGPTPFESTGQGLVVDAARYREAAGEVEVGLLATALAESGHETGYIDLQRASGDPAMLLAMDLEGSIPHAFLNDFPVLADLPPDFASAEAERVVEQADLIVSPDPGVIPFVAERTTAEEVMVLIVTAPPSAGMRERGDTVTPVVMTIGLVHQVLDASGVEQDIVSSTTGPTGLTSETTHREGLVSIVDIAPTVLDFLGVAVPEEMVGSPLEAAGSPPSGLHERYLEWREVVTPVGQAVLGLAILALIAGLPIIFGSRQPSRGLVTVVAVAGLGSLAMLVTLVPASLLPSFTWPTVVAAVLGGGAALTALALWFAGDTPTGPVITVAITGLVLVVADVAAGWRTGLTPLLGGSALDGERFFGLGNPYAGIVLSGAVLGAVRLPHGLGVALMAGAALFAGLPFLGADVGGCITLAICAALWYGATRWDRLDRRTWALAVGAALLAVVALIVSHRLLPPGQTHVSRALSGSNGVLGAVEVFWERLRMNIASTSATPSAWLAVIGLPVWLWVASRPPTRLRALLRGDPLWRWTILVLTLGGIFGYVLNDTFGMAGITVVFVSAAVVYPALSSKARQGVRKTRATEPAGG
ncbi:MAG: hypothetical protein ACRDH9_03295 [Actinomycetota bacterium]